MKNIVLIILCAVLTCSAFAHDVSPELMDADRAFNKLSQEKGMKLAFLEFADEKVIKLSNKEFAVRNKAELEKWFGDEPIEFKLEWKPVFAEASEEGEDMGYTFGIWRMTLKDGTIRYGEYVTFWKLQEDGSWKYVVDGGNSTPDNPDAWK